MHVRRAHSNISGCGTQQEQWDFRRAWAHLFSRFHTVSPLKGEIFYLLTLLLHFKGATSVAKVSRVNDVQCRKFRDACNVRGLLADNPKSSLLLSVDFKQSSVSLTHMFAQILLNGKRRSSPDLCTDHRICLIPTIPIFTGGIWIYILASQTRYYMRS